MFDEQTILFRASFIVTLSAIDALRMRNNMCKAKNIFSSATVPSPYQIARYYEEIMLPMKKISYI